MRDGGYTELIQAVHAFLPKPILERVSYADIFVGDPIFSGVHDWETTHDGRSFRDTMHCCYTHHLLGPRDRKKTTIVMPVLPEFYALVHEYGHVLHEIIGLEYAPKPMTKYAQDNCREAFAESFCSWLLPQKEYWWYPDDLRDKDPQTHALLEGLL